LPSVKSDSPILDFISSDETLDRYDEIISTSGWRLDTYRKNPVFQNAHQYGDIIFTLGRALITELRHGTSDTHHEPPTTNHATRSTQHATRNTDPGTPFLFQRIQFATDVNPIARIAYGLYAGGFLHSVSVGFIPLRWEDGVAQASAPAGVGGVSPPLPLPQGEGRGEGEAQIRSPNAAPFRRRYLEQELLEVSAVAIPANPNALALALKSGALQKSDLRDTLDLLRQTLTEPAPRNIQHATRTTLHAPPFDLQPLLLLTHQIKHLLKKC
jgi:hypothetical protein